MNGAGKGGRGAYTSLGPPTMTYVAPTYVAPSYVPTAGKGAGKGKGKGVGLGKGKGMEAAKGSGKSKGQDALQRQQEKAAATGATAEDALQAMLASLPDAGSLALAQLGSQISMKYPGGWPLRFSHLGTLAKFAEANPYYFTVQEKLGGTVVYKNIDGVAPDMTATPDETPFTLEEALLNVHTAIPVGTGIKISQLGSQLGDGGWNSSKRYKVHAKTLQIFLTNHPDWFLLDGLGNVFRADDQTAQISAVPGVPAAAAGVYVPPAAPVAHHVPRLPGRGPPTAPAAVPTLPGRLPTLPGRGPTLLGQPGVPPSRTATPLQAAQAILGAIPEGGALPLPQLGSALGAGGWNKTYAHLGTLKSFLEGNPNLFGVIPGEGVAAQPQIMHGPEAAIVESVEIVVTKPEKKRPAPGAAGDAKRFAAVGPDGQPIAVGVPAAF